MTSNMNINQNIYNYYNEYVLLTLNINQYSCGVYRSKLIDSCTVITAVIFTTARKYLDSGSDHESIDCCVKS